MPENEIYKFLKENDLTDKDEASFTKEYSDPKKAKELHNFMLENDLTNKDSATFYETYFDPSKKKVQNTPTTSNGLEGSSTQELGSSGKTKTVEEFNAKYGTNYTDLKTGQTKVDNAEKGVLVPFSPIKVKQPSGEKDFIAPKVQLPDLTKAPMKRYEKAYDGITGRIDNNTKEFDKVTAEAEKQGKELEGTVNKYNNELKQASTVIQNELKAKYEGLLKAGSISVEEANLKFQEEFKKGYGIAEKEITSKYKPSLDSYTSLLDKRKTLSNSIKGDVERAKLLSNSVGIIERNVNAQNVSEYNSLENLTISGSAMLGSAMAGSLPFFLRFTNNNLAEYAAKNNMPELSKVAFEKQADLEKSELLQKMEAYAKEQAQKGSYYSNKITEKEGTLVDNFSQGNYAQAGKVAGLRFLESIPMMGAAIGMTALTGGTASAIIPGGFMFGSQNYYGEYADRPDMSETDKLNASFVKGSLEMITELSVMPLLSPLKSLVKTGGKEAVREAVEKTLFNSMKEGYGKLVPYFGWAQEGLSEYANEVGSTITDKILDPKFQDKDWGEVIKEANVRGLEAFGPGAFGGVALTLPVAINNTINKYQNKKMAREFASELEKIEVDIQNPNLTEAQKDILIARKQEIHGKLNEVFDADKQETAGATTEQVSALDDINDQQDEVAVALQDETISDESKVAFEEKAKELAEQEKTVLEEIKANKIVNEEEPNTADNGLSNDVVEPVVKNGQRITVGNNTGELHSDEGIPYLILDDGSEVEVSNEALKTAKLAEDNRNYRIDKNGFFEIEGETHLNPKVIFNDEGYVTINSDGGKVVKGQLAENIAYELALQKMETMTDEEAESLLGEVTTNEDIQKLITENEKRNEQIKSERATKEATEKSTDNANEQGETEEQLIEKVKRIDDDVQAANELILETLSIPENAVIKFTPKGSKEALAYTVAKNKKGELDIRLNNTKIRNPKVIEAITKLYNEGKGIREEAAYNEAHNQLEDLKAQIHKENGFDYTPQYKGEKVKTHTTEKPKGETAETPTTKETKTDESPVNEIKNGTNEINGYAFTETPSLENVIVEPITEDIPLISEQMFVSRDENIANKGITNEGGGWYSSDDSNGGKLLYNTKTKEAVRLDHKKGGIMPIIISDFVKNNDRLAKEQTANNKEQNEMDGFDFNKIIEEAEISPNASQKEIDEINEEAYQKSSFDKKWAKTYKEAKDKLVEQYNKAKKTKEEWEAKKYKSAGNKSVFVGGELEGNNISVNAINERKKQNAIKNAEEEMLSAKKDLALLGLNKNEIEELINSTKETSIKEEKVENKEQPKKKKPVRKNKVISKILDEVTVDPIDKVLQYFIGGGKINGNRKNPENAVQKIFGKKGGVKDLDKTYKSYFNLTRNNAPTISQLAHSLWEENRDNSDYTTQDYEEAIIEVLSTHNGTNSMKEAFNNKFEIDASQEEIEREAADQAYIDEQEQRLNEQGQEEFNNEIIAQENILEPLVFELKGQEIQQVEELGITEETEELTAEQFDALEALLFGEPQPINNNENGNEKEVKQGENNVTPNQSSSKENSGQDIERKSELEAKVKEAKNTYQAAQVRLTKAKQAAEKAGQEQQNNIFGGKPADALLFGTDLRSLNNKVKERQAEVDKAKENLDKAQLALDNFVPSNQVQLEVEVPTEANLIKDENGRPIVFYHGTNKQFSEFTPSSKEHEWKGIFFAYDKSYAEWRNKDRIIEANIEAKKPLDVTNDDVYNNLSQEVKDAIKQQDIPFLKSIGYDAVILKKPLGKEIVVFDSSQVKQINNKEGELASLQEQLKKAKLTATKNEIQAKIDALEGKEPKATKGSSEGLGSKTAKSTNEITPTENAKRVSMKFHLELKKLIESIGVPIAERNLSKRFLGIFKHRSMNIRVQSLFGVATAAHETAHWVSKKFGIGEALREKSAIVAANPDAQLNKDIRKALTDIYIEFYPNAKKEHSLYLRVEEGIAVLMEHYLTDPTDISNRYGILVDNFIAPTGKYYHPKFTELLDKLNKFIGEYSDLSPNEKIGSRIVSGEEVTKKNEGFTPKQAVIRGLVNAAEPLRRADNIADAGLTEESTEVAYIRWLSRAGIIAPWITGETHPITLDRNGNWKEVGASVKDYLELIKGREKEFSQYLVARRNLGDVNYLTEMENELAEILADIENEEDLTKEEVEEINELSARIEKQKQIIKNDNFDIQEVTETVRMFEDEFKAPVAIYDKLNNAAVDFAQKSGLISSETADAYKANTTYTSFKRQIMDDIASNVLAPGTSSQSKVSAFKERKGSDLAIIDPVYSQIQFITETLNKGMQNMIWQKLAALGNDNVELARRFEKVETIRVVDPISGKITYPQMGKPGLIMVKTNGKPSFYLAAPEYVALAETLTPKELETMAYILTKSAGIFSRLTTSANPLFPLVNIPIDTMSAWMNTKTGFIPGWSQMRAIPEMASYAKDKALLSVKNLANTAIDFLHNMIIIGDWFKGIKNIKIKNLSLEEQNLFAKYLALGGSTQTLSSYLDMSPEEMIKAITEKSLAKKVAQHIDDFTLGILEMPSNASEYMTRFAEFKRAKDQGHSDDVAMYMAAHVSVPFIQSGTYGGQVGKTTVKAVPYFHASVQVLSKFIQTAKNDPIRTATIGAALIAIKISQTLLTMALADDDDKRMLAEQEASELGKYIYVPNKLFGGKGFTRIRFGNEFGTLSAPIEMMILQNKGLAKYNYKDYLDATTTAIPQQFNIFKPTEALWAYTPQIVRPSLEVGFNVRTYPNVRPIVPYGVSFKSPMNQYNQYTTETSKYLGKLAGVSPMKIDYFIKAQFGKVPDMLLRKGELIAFDKKDKSKSQIFLQEEQYVLAGRNYNDFYENQKYWSELYNDIRADKKSASELTESDREIIQNHQIFEATGRVMKELRDRVNKGEELPEQTKQAAFQLLKGLNSSDKPYTLTNEYTNLINQLK